MRRAAAFLALLLCLYWTRAQGESGGLTENDVTQTEDQSEILGVKATSDQTNFTPDIWAELKELRDMVIVHSVELRNLEQENTDLKARLNTAENEVEELKRENTAIQARLTASDIMNAVLDSRLNTAENEVEELKRENTDLLARVTATENKSTVLETRMNASENEVEELQRESAERKMAFSAGLGDVGDFGPFNTDTTLKFSRIHTNFGQAYNPTTGVFTAPVRGTYYFRFNGFERRETHSMGIRLFHNNKKMTFSYDRVVGNGLATVSNAFVLQLEKGDVIYLVLPSGYSLYDDSYNRTTFSGFLLFTM